MKKLITLTGDSGCGKTHLMKLLLNLCSEDIAIIKKYSDRDLRPGEENAIEIKPGFPTKEVKNMDYTYIGKNDKVYGFQKKDIETAFKQGKSPIVIVDDENLLIKLCEEYQGRICPVYIQRDVTELDFIEELRKDGRTEKQIRERIDSRHKNQALWRKRANLFGYRYIINGPFLSNENLIGWFLQIAEENNIDITKIERESNVKGIINYFRTLWKGRPAILNSDKGCEPILYGSSEEER